MNLDIPNLPSTQSSDVDGLVTSPSALNYIQNHPFPHDLMSPMPLDLGSFGDSESDDEYCRDMTINAELLSESINNVFSAPTMTSWKTLTYPQLLAHMQVKPLTGGLTNLIFTFDFKSSLESPVDDDGYVIPKPPTAESRKILIKTLIDEIGEESYKKLSLLKREDLLKINPTRVVVRIYGTELFANRERELNIVSLASQWGFSENLIASWPRGRATTYLKGGSVAPEDWYKPNAIEDATPLLGQFHAMPVKTQMLDTELCITKNLSKWLRIAQECAILKEMDRVEDREKVSTIPELFKDVAPTAELPAPHESIAEFITPFYKKGIHEAALKEEPAGYSVMPTREQIMYMLSFLSIDYLANEVEYLNKAILDANLYINFCHNDFHGGNVIYNGKDAPQNNATNGKSLPLTHYKLIDFEYGGLNIMGFDISNSLEEMETICYAGEYPGFIVDIDNNIRKCLTPTTDKSNPTFEDYKYNELEVRFAEGYIRGYEQILATLDESEYTQDHVNSHGLLVKGINPTNFKSLTPNRVLTEASIAQLGSHLLWSVWSIIMADMGTITSFGYIEYAVVRMIAYHQKKKLLQEMGLLP